MYLKNFIFKKLFMVLYSVHWYMHMFTLKHKYPCCSGGKLVNTCISATGVRSVDLYHHKTFKAFLPH